MASLTECHDKCTPSCDILRCSRESPCPNVCAGRGILHSTDPAIGARPAGACAGTLELRGVRVQGRRVEGPPFAWDERYPALVRCQGAWVLTTRNYRFAVPNAPQDAFHNDGKDTTARVLQGTRWLHNATVTAGESTSIPHFMAHNTAGACLAEASSALSASPILTFFGGQKKPGKRAADDRGIRRCVRNPHCPPEGPTARIKPWSCGHSDMTRASSQGGWCAKREPEARQLEAACQMYNCELVLEEPWRNGCVERRETNPQGCEFDGRVSTVRHAVSGELLLYVRANLHRGNGARHAQVAGSKDGGHSWSNFSLLDFDTVNIREENNIYYVHVQNLHSGVYGGDGDGESRASTDRLIGIYPAVIDGVGGIFASFGTDGVHWSRPELLLRTPIHSRRTLHHPAGVIEHRDGAVSVYVLEHIDLTERPWSKKPPWVSRAVWCNCAPPVRPTLCRYDVPREWRGGRRREWPLPPNADADAPRVERWPEAEQRRVRSPVSDTKLTAASASIAAAAVPTATTLPSAVRGDAAALDSSSPASPDPTSTSQRLLSPDCTLTSYGGGARAPHDYNYGKWTICEEGLATLALQRPPAIFSIGIGDDLTFDAAVIRRHGAHVSCFDPTISRGFFSKLVHKFSERANLTVAQSAQMRFHRVALAATDGNVSFYRKAHGGWHAETATWRPGLIEGAELVAPAWSLPTMQRMAGTPRVDLVKVDAEASEFSVLESAATRRWLAESQVKQLAVEFHERFLQGVADGGVGRRQAISRALASCGFALRYIGGQNDHDALYVRTAEPGKNCF